MSLNDRTIVAYVRTNTLTKRARTLIDQERWIRKWAFRNGYNLLRVYRDEAKSGFSGFRPGFEQILQDIGTGELSIQYVVALNYSRIARNERKLLEAQGILGAHGVKFRTLLDPLPNAENDVYFISGLNESYCHLVENLKAKYKLVGQQENKPCC